MDVKKRYRIPQSEIDKLTPDEKAKRRAKQKLKWNDDNHEKVMRMRKENIVKTKVTRKAQITKHRRENPLISFTTSTIHRMATEKAKEIMAGLPYTQSDFVNHIESLWESGMSWDNRNEWHIDHIKPLSVFIKEGESDIKTINALSNLQPLWVNDNLTKGAKYNEM